MCQTPHVAEHRSLPVPDGLHGLRLDQAISRLFGLSRTAAAALAEAQADVSAERAEFDNQRALVFEEIQDALIRAQSAKRLVDLYGHTLRPQAQATLKSTVAAYEADRTDFLNLLDSQNATLEVELDYYRAASELESRIADLERAAGASLTRDGFESNTLVPQASLPQITPEVRQ